MSTPFQIVWRGLIHDSTGYARASREYVLALDELGVDVKIEPINRGTAQAPMDNAKVARLNTLAMKPLSKGRKVLIFHNQPINCDPVKERAAYDKVTCYTTFETDSVLPSWREALDKYDHTFVPCKHNAERIGNATVVPHGVSPLPGTEKMRLPFLDDRYVFLSVFAWQHRKAPDVLLRAFWMAFTAKDPVALVIKTAYSNEQPHLNRMVRDKIWQFKQSLNVTKGAPVHITTEHLHDQELGDLMRACDGFVLPSRGEGFGLPYYEAIMAGKPALATNWGGPVDCLTKDNAYLASYRLEPANRRTPLAPQADNVFTKDTLWAEPDVHHVADLMRQMVNDPASGVAKSERAQRDLADMTWKRSAEIIRDKVQGLLE